MFKTLDAVEDALHNVKNLLELDQGDKFRVREHAPFLMLRLGKDQECYDFIKWCATAAQAQKDWYKVKEQDFLNCHGADMFEGVHFLTKVKDVNLLVAAVLLKVRILLNLERKQSNGDQDEVTPSTTSGATAPQIHVVDDQLDALLKTVKRSNKHMLKMFLHPETHLKMHIDGPPAASPPYGSLPEAQATLQKCYDAWMETDGAMEWIRKKVE
ncbi:hypothetical protein HDV00_009179 [Rhizophlyctis rosea]|nr:hypothetical protein HDV00_009179 [Rhizophlyctis rosea]